MGVTVHCFSFDAAVWAMVSEAPLSAEAFFEAGVLDEALEVTTGARGWVTEIDTPIGDNKKWYVNLSADSIYEAARVHLPSDERESLDALMQLLFWQVDHGQVVMDGCTRVYGPELLARAHELSRYNTWVLGQALEAAACAPDRLHIEHDYLWDPDHFMAWVDTWLKLLERARKSGPMRSLLMYIWV